MPLEPRLFGSSKILPTSIACTFVGNDSDASLLRDLSTQHTNNSKRKIYFLVSLHKQGTEVREKR